MRVVTLSHFPILAAPESTSPLLETVGLAGLIEHQLLLLFPRRRVMDYSGVVWVTALLLLR